MASEFIFSDMFYVMGHVGKKITLTKKFNYYHLRLFTLDKSICVAFEGLLMFSIYSTCCLTDMISESFTWTKWTVPGVIIVLIVHTKIITLVNNETVEDFEEHLTD